MSPPTEKGAEGATKGATAFGLPEWTPRSSRRLQPSAVRQSRRRTSSSSSSGDPADFAPSERDFGREIRLLRVRLEELRLRVGTAIERPVERPEGTDEKENRRTPPVELLRTYHSELQSICNALLEGAGRMYKSELGAENGALRHKLAAIDARIADVLAENALLRWENEQTANETAELRRRLDQKLLAVRELHAELRCLKSNQAEINRIHAAKLQDEIAALRADHKQKAERMEREFESKLKEEQRLRRRAQDECVFLKAQEAAPKTLDRLAEDNRELYRKLLDTRRKFNEQLNAFYDRESQLTAQLKAANSPADAPEPPESKQNVRFGTVERISPDGRIHRQSVADWEEKFGALRREYELERQQRKDVTRILIEMSRDMKTLLGRLKEQK